MNMDLSNIISSFTGLTVIVFGDAMLDVYLEGASHRLCREAPVPVISVSGRKTAPGGAANTAVNVAALGGSPLFLSVTGDDAEGELLAALLEEKKVSTEHLLRAPGVSTITKHRLIAAGQMLLRFDQGSVPGMDTRREEEIIERLTRFFPGADAVIVSDYGYGMVTPPVIRALAGLQKRFPRTIVVDARRPERFRDIGVTAVKPNYGEAARILGLPRIEGLNARVRQIAACESQILERTGARIAAVTLDADGAILFERDKPSYRTYARPAAHSRATGAGDTFVSALTLALAAGADTPCSAELASAASSIVVAKEGTAACSGIELKGLLSAGSKYIRDRANLVSLEAFYHRQGARVVFTNGCFDILHRGHVTYLSHAKALGDVLVVGVNADESVRRLKGPGRPINVLEDRMQVLAALSCVDHVAGFAEDSPRGIIRILRPDVYAKGGDYSLQTLPEAGLVQSLGGEVRILPYLADNSTTGIIERIHKTDRQRPESAAVLAKGPDKGGS